MKSMHISKISYTAPLIILIGCIGIISCASNPASKGVSELKGRYLADGRNASVDIVYERGRNSHRFLLIREATGPQVFVFHDRQLFKNMQVNDDRFRELLSKSLDAADSLIRKPAKKVDAPCRTPFLMTLKNTQETHRVEGCRASEEGAVIGKLIAEIEHMLYSVAH